MDWFERITGFREQDPSGTRARLRVEGTSLVSLADGSSHGIGRLTLPSLQELRARTAPATRAGALFQVASQFNLLEMVGPDVSPDDGVTRCQRDHTQGPACAMAAGAATIYRNDFAPVGDAIGQTAARQLDALAQRVTAHLPPECTAKSAAALSARAGADRLRRGRGRRPPPVQPARDRGRTRGLNRSGRSVSAAGSAPAAAAGWPARPSRCRPAAGSARG